LLPATATAVSSRREAALRDDKSFGISNCSSTHFSRNDTYLPTAMQIFAGLATGL
jgi:hypothetical protein